MHEADGEIVACGGWSKRNRLYTGSGAAADDGRLLDPATEPARVRAMFVRGDWTRRGLGRAILERCERDARADGFTTLALMATLPGEPLYRAYGFRETARTMVRAARRDRARRRRDGAAVRAVLITGPPTSAQHREADRGGRRRADPEDCAAVTTTLPTSLVGSYAQPNWLIDREKLAARFPPRVRALELWRVDPQWLEEAQDDATLLAIRDQERAGLDIVTDGEMRRESYSNRFANALDRHRPRQPRHRARPQRPPEPGAARGRPDRAQAPGAGARPRVPAGQHRPAA